MLKRMFKKEQTTRPIHGIVTAPNVSTNNELDGQIAKREAWLLELNALQQELDTAKIAVDHYRSLLQTEFTEPALIGNSTFEEAQKYRTELKRQLHDALRNQNRIEELIGADGNRYGSRDAIQAEVQSLQSQKLAMEREADEDAIKGIDKEILRLLEAVKQRLQDRNVLGAEHFEKYGQTIPEIVPPGFFEPAYGMGQSTIWINGVKYLLGRWDPELLSPDDPVRKHLSEFPSANSLHFTSWSGERF